MTANTPQYMVVTGHRIKFFINADFREDCVYGREVYLSEDEEGNTVATRNESPFLTRMTDRPNEVILFSEYPKVIAGMERVNNAFQKLCGLALSFHTDEVLRDGRIEGENARMDVTGTKYEVVTIATAVQSEAA